MSFSVLASPGTEYGPCADYACDHRDCAFGRSMAEEPCTVCGEAIGFDTAFFRIGETHGFAVGGLRDSTGSLVILCHARCFGK